MGPSDLTSGVAADAAASTSGSATCAFCIKGSSTNAEGAAFVIEGTSSGAVGAAFGPCTGSGRTSAATKGAAAWLAVGAFACEGRSSGVEGVWMGSEGGGPGLAWASAGSKVDSIGMEGAAAASPAFDVEGTNLDDVGAALGWEGADRTFDERG